MAARERASFSYVNLGKTKKNDVVRETNLAVVVDLPEGPHVFIVNLTPLDMYNGLSKVDCIKP